MNDLFTQMKAAPKATVTDPDGRALTVLCREVGASKTLLLLDPNNERSTAESLNLRAFAARFKSVTLLASS